MYAPPDLLVKIFAKPWSYKKDNSNLVTVIPNPKLKP
jgi:hypothetical protein